MRANEVVKIYFLVVFIAAVIVVVPLNTAAQDAAGQNQEAPPAKPSAGNPEYKIKKLPNDTFKPSEKISEDFPVPFPVDI